MPSSRTRQAKSIFLVLLFIALLWPGAGCHQRTYLAGTEDVLLHRLAERMTATGTFSEAEEILVKERARGEEGRARMLAQVLFLRTDPLVRAELLGRLSDVPRPADVPYIDQQLGLEPDPPYLSSSAAPRALKHLAQALAGQGLLGPLLRQAVRYADGGEFLEAAGTLSLVHAVAQEEHPPRAVKDQVMAAWRNLGQRRRCVAQFLDAARPGPHLLYRPPPDLPELGQDMAVAELLTMAPDALPCAVIAMQLATTRPTPYGLSGWADRVLLAPILVGAQYASLDLTSAERRQPAPLLRGEPSAVRAALYRGIEHYLKINPAEVQRLLPLLGQDPGGVLARDRRDDLLLSVLFAAPPQPEAAAQIGWAFERHHAGVADQPLRYVEYLAALGPDFARPLARALRAPQPAVVAAVVAALTPYPLGTVEEALAQPELLDEHARGVLPQERRHLRQRSLSLQALFRLPLRSDSKEEQQEAWRQALNLHRCCRGDQGTCDRLSVPAIKRCPAWVPLAWW